MNLQLKFIGNSMESIWIPYWVWTEIMAGDPAKKIVHMDSMDWVQSMDSPYGITQGV
jgi:hypothetical protein